MATAIPLDLDLRSFAPDRRARRPDLTRFAVLGDGAVAHSADRGPGPAEQLAQRLGARALNLAQEGATARDVVAEQLDLALALEPTFALVCVGTTEAATHLDAASQGDAAFLNALLADLHVVTGKLRAHGAEVLLVRPPTLAVTPAAWLRFGARWRPGTVRQALRRDPRVRALGAAGTRWSKGVAALAEAYDARFVDLAHIADAALVRAAGDGIGLPPQCGGDTDLFFDALHLSDLGARLAADRLAEALDVGV